MTPTPFPVQQIAERQWQDYQAVDGGPRDRQSSRAVRTRPQKGAPMIDVYGWTTPNGHKVTIVLEEAGLPYRIIPTDIGAGDQFKPDFLASAPNNRFPAIVDTDPAGGSVPIGLFEASAILQLLAETTGRFLSADIRVRAVVMQ